MVQRNKTFIALCVIMTLLGWFFAGGEETARAEGEVTMFTPYTNIDVTPGKTVNYSIDIINNTGSVQNALLNVQGLPAEWEYKLTAGGWNIKQLSVKPNGEQTVTLQLDVPLQVNKGTYSFTVSAQGMATLPLTVNVTEQGSYNTELTTEQPNMEGHADSTFSYSVSLRNNTAEKQTYALTSEAERGWDIRFKADGNNVTSVAVDPGASKSITVEAVPPNQVNAGTYKIPITASSGSLTAKLELEAVVTGSFKVELTTPSGLLSTSVTAGDSKTLDLVVKNSGSARLTDLEMNASPPPNWEVTFEPKKINSLEPGQSTTVKATIKADKKAIAGDYVTGMSVRSPEASSEAQFRVAVKTSVLWGWLGILIVAAVIGFVYYLFRTYGRR